MSLFLRSMKNECVKLMHRKKYLVFLLLEVFICLCVLLIQLAVHKATGGEFTFQMADLPLLMLSFFIQIYIPLIVFMSACDLFSTEMQDQTIKAVLMRPISRFKVFLSKAAAISLFTVVYLAALFLITSVIEAATSGKIANLWISFSAYLLDIIPILVLVFMAVLINQVTKSSSLAMFLCLLVYVVFTIVGMMIPETSGLLFTGYFQWHKVWLGATLPFGAIVSKIGLLLGYGLVFGCAGFYLFDSRDF